MSQIAISTTNNTPASSNIMTLDNSNVYYFNSTVIAIKKSDLTSAIFKLSCRCKAVGGVASIQNTFENFTDVGAALSGTSISYVAADNQITLYLHGLAATDINWQVLTKTLSVDGTL